jgi:hypothetical protein
LPVLSGGVDLTTAPFACTETVVVDATSAGET